MRHLMAMNAQLQQENHDLKKKLTFASFMDVIEEEPMNEIKLFSSQHSNQSPKPKTEPPSKIKVSYSKDSFDITEAKT